MKKIIILICFLLITTYASAGYNICYDANGLNLRVIQSDPMTPTCIYYSDHNMTEYIRVKNLYKTVGLKYLKVVNGVVTEMSQFDKDVIDQTEQYLIDQAELNRINNLDNNISATNTSNISLTKVDNAIDNIGNLADAKAFLKKLCHYIVANQ